TGSAPHEIMTADLAPGVRRLPGLGQSVTSTLSSSPVGIAQALALNAQAVPGGVLDQFFALENATVKAIPAFSSKSEAESAAPQTLLSTPASSPAEQEGSSVASPDSRGSLRPASRPAARTLPDVDAFFRKLGEGEW